MAESDNPARLWWGLSIVLLAFALRGWNLHATGYTADEVSELLDARRPYADIIADRDDDLFPPLYRLTLATWNRMWGDERAARWLNVVLGVATVGVMLRIGALSLGEAKQNWPALVLAISPFHIHFCREGRAYALFVLLAAVAWWRTLEVIREGKWWNWLSCGVAMAAAIWAHWYAAPLMVLLWLAAVIVSGPRDGWRPAALGTLAAALLLAPAPLILLQALRDLQHEKLYAKADAEAVGYLYFAQAAGFTVGPSMIELRSIPAKEGIKQMAPWLGVVGLACVPLFALGLGQFADRRIRTLTLVALLAVVPAFALLDCFTGNSFVFRYYAWLTIPYAVALGAGAARPGWVGKAALILLVGVAGCAWWNKLYDARYAEEDARAVVALLNERGSPERPVLVASDYMRQALEYFSEPQRFKSFPIRTDRQAEIPARVNAFVGALPSGAAYWIVSQWLPEDDGRYAIRERVLKELGAKFVTQENQFLIYEAQVR